MCVQLCPPLCNSMDCSLPGSSVFGIFPGKNAGVGCHSLLQGSSRHRDQTRVSCIAGGFSTYWATKEALIFHNFRLKRKLSQSCVVCLFYYIEQCPGPKEYWTGSSKCRYSTFSGEMLSKKKTEQHSFFCGENSPHPKIQLTENLLLLSEKIWH